MSSNGFAREALTEGQCPSKPRLGGASSFQFQLSFLCSVCSVCAVKSPPPGGSAPQTGKRHTKKKRGLPTPAMVEPAEGERTGGLRLSCFLFTLARPNIQDSRRKTPIAANKQCI